MADISDNEFEDLPVREPTWMILRRATACRKQLLAADYSPLPINGKAPPIIGWQDIQATNELINSWEDQYADATNTGILTRTTPAIDIDVVDPDVADELQQIAERMFGANGVRIGQSPKRAMLYRTDVPFDKLATPIFVSPDGHSHKVEVLCSGQQIVVHGIHPTTQAPYTWQGAEPGRGLKRNALPLLSADKAIEFIAAAEQCMAAHGWTPKKKVNGRLFDATCNNQTIASERERVYARATLEGCSDELARATPGERNDTANKKAFRLGTMVARGWISADEVLVSLLRAADACGLNQDDGEELTRKTVESGLQSGKQFPHPDLSAVFSEAVSGSWNYHIAETPAPPRWLIKGILPEVGAALMAGQWGAFKTTIALDFSVCVMSNLPFASRYYVKRPGAVLYLALEGAGMLPTRLSAIAAHRGVSGPLPFAWRGDCPVLTAKNVVDALCSIANEAAVDLKRRFDFPVSMIWIDTLITAAGFASGEDNDAAAAQRVRSPVRFRLPGAATVPC
jgi:hypothetical protein